MSRSFARTVTTVKMVACWFGMSYILYMPRKTYQSSHPLYFTWRAMKNRCLSKASDCFAHYGGRGIKVCERWMDFANLRRTWASDRRAAPLTASTTMGTTSLETCAGRPGPSNCATQDVMSRLKSKALHIVFLSGARFMESASTCSASGLSLAGRQTRRSLRRNTRGA